MSDKLTAKQTSNVFHQLEEVVKSTTAVVTGMDTVNDSSHGLFFSAALTGEQTGVHTNLVVWGNAKDISSMLFTACSKSPELAALVTKCAVNLAVDKAKSNGDKMFTGEAATLMIANDRSLVVPGEEN